MLKKKIYFMGFLALVSLASCKKFLDLKPKTDIGESVALNTKDRIQRALTGAYSRFQVQEYYGFEWSNAVWLSDDNVTSFGAGTTDLQFDNHEVLASSNTIEINWRAMYQAVNATNNVIDATQTVNDPSFTQAEKDNVAGQAYFLRALVYFDMVRTWGGVPLALTPTRGYDPSSVSVKRSTVAEVYAQILKDLDAAESKMPDTHDRNIATRKAAQALKAKVYLYLQDWANAEKYATIVIADNAYTLMKPFDNLITVKANAESIFELDYNPTDGNFLAGAFYPTDMGGGYRVGPSNEITSILKDPTQGGDRKTLIAYDNGNVYGNRYREVGSGKNDDNYAVLRLAEMYLIRAEARAHQNNIQGGLDDLNVIRNRANAPLVSSTTAADLLQSIENENRMEFALEPHRWFDLIRTGRAAAVLGVTDIRKYVFPIPTTEIVANPNLTQNPGY